MDIYTIAVSRYEDTLGEEHISDVEIIPGVFSKQSARAFIMDRISKRYQEPNVDDPEPVFEVEVNAVDNIGMEIKEYSKAFVAGVRYSDHGTIWNENYHIRKAEATMKKKIFISQPMHGLTKKQVIAKRQVILGEYAKALKMDPVDFTQEYSVIDNYRQFAEPKDLEGDALRMWRCANSIKKMAEADLVIFSKDWPNAEGCKLEMNFCLTYHKPVLVEGSLDWAVMITKEV